MHRLCKQTGGQTGRQAGTESGTNTEREKGGGHSRARGNPASMGQLDSTRDRETSRVFFFLFFFSWLDNRSSFYGKLFGIYGYSSENQISATLALSAGPIFFLPILDPDSSVSSFLLSFCVCDTEVSSSCENNARGVPNVLAISVAFSSLIPRMVTSIFTKTSRTTRESDFPLRPAKAR